MYQRSNEHEALEKKVSWISQGCFPVKLGWTMRLAQIVMRYLPGCKDLNTITQVTQLIRFHTTEAKSQ